MQDLKQLHDGHALLVTMDKVRLILHYALKLHLNICGSARV